ncbi:uncharacterized protein LOC143862506 [Tasmannia lanceolata]|uniref:uncharacterized protein LOC143862506 n=1 Tax=Tasmannia lanceolata TaxID=3420 RepID=UPI0040643E8B
MASATPPSLPFKKSRVRVSSKSLLKHPQTLLLFIILLSTITSSSSSLHYRDHCNSIVPEPTSNGLEPIPLQFLNFHDGYFTGGEKIMPQDPEYSSYFPKSTIFRTRTLHKTETKGVLKVEARLIFSVGRISGNWTTVHRREARIYKRGRINFELRGFWSESTENLCMVGSGYSFSKEGNLVDLSVILKLNYPNISNISTSLVTGKLESVDAVDKPGYFDPIPIIAFSQKTYNYTLVSQPEKMCSGISSQEKSLGLEPGMNNICSMLYGGGNSQFQLEYKSNCSDTDCSPFNRSSGFLPRFMSVGGIQCSDKGKLRLYLGFSNSSAYNNIPLIPETSLVGEGIWDEGKNRLCMIACSLRKLNNDFANTSVRDCTVGLSLRFPKTLSIRERSIAVGRMWSNRKTNESNYFEEFVFRTSYERTTAVWGLNYEYTQVDRVRKLCGKKDVGKPGRRYPDGFSYGDMAFDLSVKNSPGNFAGGYFSPLSYGDKIYDNGFASMGGEVLEIGFENSVSVSSMPPSVEVRDSNHSLLNVSYAINFWFPAHFKWGGLPSSKMSYPQIHISAEGVYDAGTGMLCMVGCRRLDSISKKSNENLDSMDCEILISVQFPPLNRKDGERLKGTVNSTRKPSDFLYFEPLELSSNVAYGSEIKESIWRMDLEITMVLISLTLACVFIGVQIFYVKKNQDVLPSISLVMLVVLTLGHMIPLVLNFEAFFTNRNRQNLLLWSGGWLEANEVVVRIITMVAFLMQFRLLQLTWSAKIAEGSKKGLWVAEKKALYLCLPLYIFGGLIAWFLRWKMFDVVLSKARFFVGSRHSIWDYLKSYAGLILDGFLLPQILLNLFLNSKDKALSPTFYVGTTVVRLLPHAYDAYRAPNHVPQFNSSYIYANPDGDFYSTAWDVIIPCGGVLFAVLIYLQQRFGGACVLPQRFRQLAEYEKVPVVSA